MTWKLPPRIKIYEALGAVADGRIESTETGAKVTSSEGNKVYDVVFDKNSNMITANDNGSFWQGYLGYPAIAYLFQQKLLLYDEKYGNALQGITWKEINSKFKNDWTKTEQWIYTNVLPHSKIDPKDIEHFAGEVAKAIDTLQLQKPAKRQLPPKSS